MTVLRTLFVGQWDVAAGNYKLAKLDQINVEFILDPELNRFADDSAGRHDHVAGSGRSQGGRQEAGGPGRGRRAPIFGRPTYFEPETRAALPTNISW